MIYLGLWILIGSPSIYLWMKKAVPADSWLALFSTVLGPIGLFATIMTLRDFGKL